MLLLRKKFGDNNRAVNRAAAALPYALSRDLKPICGSSYAPLNVEPQGIDHVIVNKYCGRPCPNVTS